MATWLVAVVQGLHMLFGIFWFGSVLTLVFVVAPVLGRAPQPGKQTFVAALERRIHRLLPPIAGMTIVLGILRGTVLGPINSLEVATSTAYGRTWLAALVLGIATLLLGARGMGGSFTRLAGLVLTADDAARAAYTAQLRQIRLVGYLTLTGFLGTFICMVLMRFGY
jgi:putative copper export protein